MDFNHINDIKEITRQILKDEDFWPMWPFLPVKRYYKDQEQELGVIWAGAKFDVTICNVFALPGDPTDRKGIRKLRVEEFKRIPAHTYLNVEDVVKDGWVVD